MIKLDIHKNGCTCSYCNGQVHYGLNIPKRWNSHNSWYVIKFGNGKYFRWTNHWFKRFSREVERLKIEKCTKID